MMPAWNEYIITKVIIVAICVSIVGVALIVRWLKPLFQGWKR